MRILITGAHGFIGFWLSRRLSYENGIKVVTNSRTDGDTTSPLFWSKLGKFDCVIHLADKNDINESWSCPNDFAVSNASSITNAIQYCAKNKSRLIYPSSFLYKQNGHAAYNEDCELKAYNPYACSKIYSENLISIFRDTGFLDAYIIRLFNVYGPMQKSSFLIPEIISQLKNGNGIYLRDLNPIRDYIYIEDVTEVIYKLLHYTGLKNVFNVGSGVGHSVYEVAEAINELSGKNCSINSSKKRRKNEINSAIADISRIKEELKFQPKYSLKDGLALTLKSHKLLKKL